MPTKLERLLFAQGGLCFFCDSVIPKGEASVEHLVALARGGGNDGDNCVACCKTINALFGSMSVKEKFRVVLNQKGQFKCPGAGRKTPSKAAVSKPLANRVELVIADLQKRGTARPKTVKKLLSTINAGFQKALTDGELEALLKQLQAKGFVSVDGTKVAYEK